MQRQRNDALTRLKPMLLASRLPGSRNGLKRPDDPLRHAGAHTDGMADPDPEQICQRSAQTVYRPCRDHIEALRRRCQPLFEPAPMGTGGQANAAPVGWCLAL